jgi:hypothetical protein
MRGEHGEGFTLRTTSLTEVQHVKYSVVLPRTFDAVYELVGDDEPDVQLEADTELDHEGRKVFTWRADKVPALTEVGMRMELKPL